MPRPAHHLSASELVTELSESLYGSTWRRSLAAALGLSPTLVAGWGRGGAVSVAMRRVLRDWAAAETRREAERTVRRLELLSALRALPDHDTPTTKED